MSASLLDALERRAADSDPSRYLHLRVGPEAEAIVVDTSTLPADGFLAALARQRENFDAVSPWPERDAAFLRLLCRFLSVRRNAISQCDEYKVTFASFCQSFSPEEADLISNSETLIGEQVEDLVAACSPAFVGPQAFRDSTAVRREMQRVLSAPGADVPPLRDWFVPATNFVIMKRLDATRALARSRIQLILRGGYLEFPPDIDFGEQAPAASAPPAVARQGTRWHARTLTASVVNEVRVRGIEPVPGEEAQPGFSGALYFFDNGNPGAPEIGCQRRLVPAFTLWGRLSASHRGGPGGDGGEWRPICQSEPVRGDSLEVRVFALPNVPVRRALPPSLETAFLALDEDILWAELDFHAVDDLTFGLARAILARRSKLKTFLTPGHWLTGDDDTRQRIKQWPAKDAVQALAVWWIASALVDDHRYTEPELYAVIESLSLKRCADFAVVRKEMCRRRYLEQPLIETNADRTTSTYYVLDRAGMHAALRGEWRSKGVF